MNAQVKKWIEKSQTDKDFTKNLAQKALSEVLGKSKSPSSVKIKIKFDKSKNKAKTHKHKVQKKERIF